MSISLDTILYICGAIISIASTAAVISKIIHKSIVKTTESCIENALRPYTEHIDEQMIALLNQFKEYKIGQDKHNETVRKSLLASTRSQINDAHDKYMKLRFIGSHSLYIVEELYKSYSELGGNSFISSQMNEIRSLEVVSAEMIEPDKYKHTDDKH